MDADKKPIPLQIIKVAVRFTDIDRMDEIDLQLTVRNDDIFRPTNKKLRVLISDPPNSNVSFLHGGINVPIGQAIQPRQEKTVSVKSRVKSISRDEIQVSDIPCSLHISFESHVPSEHYQVSHNELEFQVSVFAPYLNYLGPPPVWRTFANIIGINRPYTVIIGPTRSGKSRTVVIDSEISGYNGDMRHLALCSTGNDLRCTEENQLHTTDAWYSILDTFGIEEEYVETIWTESYIVCVLNGCCKNTTIDATEDHRSRIIEECTVSNPPKVVLFIVKLNTRAQNSKTLTTLGRFENRIRKMPPHKRPLIFVAFTFIDTVPSGREEVAMNMVRAAGLNHIDAQPFYVGNIVTDPCKAKKDVFAIRLTVMKKLSQQGIIFDTLSRIKDRSVLYLEHLTDNKLAFTVIIFVLTLFISHLTPHVLSRYIDKNFAYKRQQQQSVQERTEPRNEDLQQNMQEYAIHGAPQPEESSVI